MEAVCVGHFGAWRVTWRGGGLVRSYGGGRGKMVFGRLRVRGEVRADPVGCVMLCNGGGESVGW